MSDEEIDFAKRIFCVSFYFWNDVQMVAVNAEDESAAIMAAIEILKSRDIATVNVEEIVIEELRNGK